MVYSSDETTVKATESSQKISYLMEEPVSSVAAGKHYIVGLRTVPVTLKNGDRSVIVNALLDDASTKIYINADVAAELGLKGKTEKVTVNVLNGQVETFETRPVNVELKSVHGNVSLTVPAYTANRVTGSITVVDEQIQNAMATSGKCKLSAICNQTNSRYSYWTRLCRSALCT